MSTKPKNPAVGQAKKLVIKPLKLKPQLPANFEEVTWAKLQDAVNAVHEKRRVATSLEELYRAVEDLCLHKMDGSLYSRLQAACDAHIGAQMAALRERTQLDPVAFLDHVDALWKDYCSQMLTIRSIFLYLDRTYVIGLSGMRSLFDMGLQLLRQHLLAHPEVEGSLVAGLLALIERERQGDAVDRALLASLLRCLGDLGLYTGSFEGRFLSDTGNFYRGEGQRLMGELDTPQYLAHCEVRLQQEYDRCVAYLDDGSRKPLLAAVEAQLVAAHLPAILSRGFAGLLDAHRVADLGRLYTLSGRVQAHPAVRQAFREYIMATGAAVVKDEEKDKEMVERLLDLKAKLDEVVGSAMGRAEPFANTLKDAFEAFINLRQNKPAELVAKFIDARLRAQGSKGLSEEELEATLDQALTLFRFIQGKDVFEAFYKKDLAKRLLLGKSASIDAEKGMIAKLKAECGAQFTSKLEGMFKDMDLSKDVMAGFKQTALAGGRAPGGVELHVSVLTSGFWPTYPMTEVNLPEELARYQQLFTEYYLAKQGGRRLVWHNSLGSCILRAQFPKGAKELQVSLLQAAVLLLFNDADSLSFEDVKAAVGIEDGELRRTLQSLACGKVRVLRKEPAGREVGDGDAFHFNAGFTEKLFRLKINSIQLKESAEENKKTNEQVLQDRQYQIDAAIVRIMKTRKQLSHQLLVSEALGQLRFPLRGSDLKKRIESLIEREYLARDSGDANVYIYLA